jgi:hypothetical protein
VVTEVVATVVSREAVSLSGNFWVI